MPAQKLERSFRLVSIESLQSLAIQVRDIATDHGLSLSSNTESTANAPFCGYQYFSQEMTLSNRDAGHGVTAILDGCIAAIEQFTEETVADGYLEVL